MSYAFGTMRRSQTFDSGIVSVDVPADWADVSDEQALSFSPPTGIAALTVSVHDASLTLAEIDSREPRPFGTPHTERLLLTIPNGTGFVQEFTKCSGDRTVYWIAHFQFYRHATVIGSFNGPRDVLFRERATFDRVLLSIASEAR